MTGKALEFDVDTVDGDYTRTKIRSTMMMMMYASHFLMSKLILARELKLRGIGIKLGLGRPPQKGHRELKHELAALFRPVLSYQPDTW